MEKLYGSGDIARRTGMSRASLVYRIKKADLPDATHRVSRRRVFTEDDLAEIRALLKKRPALRPRQRIGRD